MNFFKTKTKLFKIALGLGLVLVIIGLFVPVTANHTSLGLNLAQAATADQQTSAGFNILDLFTSTHSLSDWLLGWISEIIVTVGAKWVWAMGLVLDAGMMATVHMKQIIDNTKIVLTGWVIFRDLANMSFIFILVYIAISTILGSGQWKRMLVNVIVTAVLINFSMFFTEVLIDASNMLALQFWDPIGEMALQAQAKQSGTQMAMSGMQNLTGVRPGSGASLIFMQSMKLQTVYTSNPPQTTLGNLVGTTANGIGTGLNFLTLAIVGTIMMFIAGITFAVGGILLLIRIVVLMFLIMMSPLAFIARIIPGMNRAWSQWVSELTKNLIFAPAYIAFTYIICKAIQSGLSPNIAGISTDANASIYDLVINAGYNSLGVLINYVFVLVLIILSQIISKQMGSYGSSAVIKMGNNVQSWAKDKVKWGAGYAVTRTAGEAARRLEERARTSPASRSWIGTRLRSLTTEPLAKTKIWGAASAEERHKEEKQRVAERADAELISQIKRIADNVKNRVPPRVGEASNEEQLQNALMKVSPSGFASLATRDLLSMPDAIRLATSAHFNALMSSTKTQKDKDALIQARFSKHIQLNDAYNDRMAKAYAKMDKELDPGKKSKLLDWILDGNMGALEAQDLIDQERNPAKKAAMEALLKDNKLDEIGVKWNSKVKADFGEIKEDIRAKKAPELAYLNRVRPDLFGSYMSSYLNWWQVKDIRGSEAFNFTQREGKGSCVRDYKEAMLANAYDMFYGIPLSDASGKPLSIEERFNERMKRQAVWEKVNRIGENRIGKNNEHNQPYFTDEEIKRWNLMKAVPEVQRQAGITIIQTHHQGRSADELNNAAGRIRNAPVNQGSVGRNVARGIMTKDKIHPKNYMIYMLRHYLDGTLTGEAADMLQGVLFDRTLRDFFPGWKDAIAFAPVDAGGMGIDPKSHEGALITKLANYQANNDTKGFSQDPHITRTVHLENIYPGSHMPPPEDTEEAESP